MRYENNATLREYLQRGAASAHREHARHPNFELDAAAFATALDEVRAQHPHLGGEQACARAAFRLLTSGAPPEVAVALPSRGYRLRAWSLQTATAIWPWMKLLWAVAVLALGIASVLFLSALAAHAEPQPDPSPAPSPANWNEQLSAIRGALSGWPALPQESNGLILQLQNGGTVLATRPAGLVILNCATNMTCSFSGSTFTLTSAAGGAGCVPPGSTSNALLYDSGGGTCGDVSEFTFASNTLSGASGATVDLSAITLFKTRVGAGAITSVNGDIAQDSSTGYWHGYVNGHDRLFIGATNVGASGQVAESNADGTATFADPIVSGPDATGVAPTRNPVQTGALDNSTACSAGPCVRSLIVADGAPGGSEYGLIVRPIPSGTQTMNLGQVGGTNIVTAGVNGTVAVGGNIADGSALSSQTNPVVVAGKGSGNARVPIVCDGWAPFSLASTTSLKIIAKASGKNVYICSIQIVSAGANNVALVAGTKTTTDCDTATAGLAGGATAATGWNFAANGGLTQGSGIGVIAATAATGLDVCLLASASTQVSGVISWTQF